MLTWNLTNVLKLKKLLIKTNIRSSIKNSLHVIISNLYIPTISIKYIYLLTGLTQNLTTQLINAIYLRRLALYPAKTKIKTINKTAYIAKSAQASLNRDLLLFLSLLIPTESNQSRLTKSSQVTQGTTLKASPTTKLIYPQRVNSSFRVKSKKNNKKPRNNDHLHAYLTLPRKIGLTPILKGVLGFKNAKKTTISYFKKTSKNLTYTQLQTP